MFRACVAVQYALTLPARTPSCQSCATQIPTSQMSNRQLYTIKAHFLRVCGVMLFTSPVRPVGCLELRLALAVATRDAASSRRSQHCAGAMPVRLSRLSRYQPRAPRPPAWRRAWLWCTLRLARARNMVDGLAPHLDFSRPNAILLKLCTICKCSPPP